MGLGAVRLAPFSRRRRGIKMTSEAEKFARELQQSRELHKEEVAFIRANPIFTPEIGAQKAKEFIANLIALTERMEGKEVDRPLRMGEEDTPAHYEVEVFFTPEQRAEVAALHARMELVDLRDKAQRLDEQNAMLERLGLRPDTLIYDDGRREDTLVIQNMQAATEWWKNAHVSKPPFDDDA
jgi:hypothetical protein